MLSLVFVAAMFQLAVDPFCLKRLFNGGSSSNRGDLSIHE